MEFIKVFDYTSIYFAAAMGIYENSFPIRERASIEELKQRLEKKDEILHVGVIDDLVIAFGLIRVFKDPEFLLFDYFAVKKNERKKGYGALFLKNLFEELNLEEQKKFMIFELEHPDFGTDRQIRRRRISYFKRFGVKVIKNVNYFLPSFEIENEHIEPLEMILMVYPIAEQQKLSSSLLRKMIFALFVQLYHQSESSKFVQEIINNIPKKIEIE